METDQLDSISLPQGLVAFCIRSLRALLRSSAPPDPVDKQSASGVELLENNASAVATEVDSCTAVLQQQIGILAKSRRPTQPAQYRTEWHNILSDVLASLGKELRKEVSPGDTVRRICAGELTVENLLEEYASNLQVRCCVPPSVD